MRTDVREPIRSNIEIDIQFGCYGGSYWDYHRGCCSCSNFNFFYYSENKSCNSCGDDAWYDYDNNRMLLRYHFDVMPFCLWKILTLLVQNASATTTVGAGAPLISAATRIKQLTLQQHSLMMRSMTGWC